jgi:type II secretory ATPase GspE/PulE/Tfp pilus assembly ATPase PilB-like protein
MEITPELRRLIHQAAPTHQLRELLRKQGALTLRDEGVQLALEGKTSLDEVLRVTHDDEPAAQPADQAGKEDKAA